MEIPTENSVPQNEMPIPMAVPLNNSAVEEVKDKRPLYLYGVIALVVYAALFFLDPKSVNAIKAVLDNGTAVLMGVALVIIAVFSFYFSAKFLKIKDNNLEKSFFVAVSLLAVKTLIVFGYSKLISGTSANGPENFDSLAVGMVAGFIAGIFVIRWTYAISLGRSLMVWVVSQILSTVAVAIIGMVVVGAFVSNFN